MRWERLVTADLATIGRQPHVREPRCLLCGTPITETFPTPEALVAFWNAAFPRKRTRTRTPKLVGREWWGACPICAAQPTKKGRKHRWVKEFATALRADAKRMMRHPEAGEQWLKKPY